MVFFVQCLACKPRGCKKYKGCGRPFCWSVCSSHNAVSMVAMGVEDLAVQGTTNLLLHL